MTKIAKIIFTILLILLATGAYLFWHNNRSVSVPPTNTGSNSGNNSGNSTTTPPTENSMIRVTSPLSNASIKSPLTVEGMARGNWYFEASFPVKLLDANGQVLAQVPAQAQGDWMTTDFVPFRVILSFTTPTTSTGTLVLEKDNPSGLSANAAEVRIPVRFAPAAATTTRTIKLYFYNETKDKDTSGNILCSAQGLVTITHVVPFTNTPIQDAIRELLKGPTTAERAQVSGTLFPLSGLALTAASLNNGTLALTFNDPENKTSGGSCRVQVLRAQIEATAKQFPGVNTVRLIPDTLFQP